MTSAEPTDLVLRWGPIPGTAQEASFDDDTPDCDLLFTGGWASGKTMTLTAKALKLSAINAPLSGIWCVPDYAHIHDTILPTLADTDPDTGDPWFLQPGQYHYHETRHVLTWQGGGPIQFVTAENPTSIAGPNVAWAAVDEPGSIKQDGSTTGGKPSPASAAGSAPSGARAGSISRPPPSWGPGTAPSAPGTKGRRRGRS